MGIMDIGHVSFSDDDLEEAQQRTEHQEAIYGKDSGYFTLGTNKKNTLTGVLGEIAVARFITERYRLAMDDVVMTDIGNTYDLELPNHDGFLHVKSGLWRSYPSPRTAFGVHAGQHLETTPACLALVSMQRGADGALPRSARIEGFLSPAELALTELIQKGEIFPGQSYPSRTENRLTYVGDFHEVDTIDELVRPKTPSDPAPSVES
jgi:hypothetical protein